MLSVSSKANARSNRETTLEYLFHHVQNICSHPSARFVPTLMRSIQDYEAQNAGAKEAAEKRKQESKASITPPHSLVC